LKYLKKHEIFAKDAISVAFKETFKYIQKVTEHAIE
jgi:hypothetical protein